MVDIKMISVMVLTRNRPDELKSCLDSLVTQTKKPDEVVVIDNGNGEGLKVANKYKTTLKVRGCIETVTGEAHARNRALATAQGDICIFIDDDCVADSKWLEEMVEPIIIGQADGVLGYSKNLLVRNVFSTTYQAYYRRWLLENGLNLTDIKRLEIGSNFFDTKNFAFKEEILSKFSFDQVSYKSTSNVDSAAGGWIKQHGRLVFNPNAVVYHRNWDSLKVLVEKNFYQAIADKLVKKYYQTDNRKKINKYLLTDWLVACRQEADQLSSFQKLWYFLLLLIYSTPYKLGRLFSYIIRPVLRLR